MFSFNLLPTPYKKKVRRWIVLKHITKSVILLNVLLIAASALLFAGNYAFQSMSGELEQRFQTEVHAASSSNVMLDIESLNQRISAMAQMQKDHAYYLKLLQEISAITPNDVQLSQFDIDLQKNFITAKGVASDRTALQQLQTNIEEHEQIEIVTFPFEAFTQVEQISFSIELQYTPTFLTLTPQHE